MNCLFNCEDYIENALSGGNNMFWQHILLSWKKMKRNVEFGITDRFKIYTEIPELFRNLLNLLLNKLYLKGRSITPEVFIHRKTVDKEVVYGFRKFQEMAKIIDNKYFTYFEYITVRHCLTPTLVKCRSLKPLTSPNFPLTPPLEYFAFHPDSKGSSKFRKLFTKKPEFDINNWPKMQNHTKLLTQSKVYFAPNEAEKVISKVYTSHTVPHARDLQIAMFRNNTYCRKTLLKKKLVDSPTCLYCDTDEDLHHRLYSCYKSKLAD